MGGAIINASGQVGRAIALAITTAIRTTVMAQARGVSVEESGSVAQWDQPSLLGLRAGHWFNSALALYCMVIVVVAFRGTGIVGKIEKQQQQQQQKERFGGEEGIMNETETSRKV